MSTDEGEAAAGFPPLSPLCSSVPPDVLPDVLRDEDQDLLFCCGDDSLRADSSATPNRKVSFSTLSEFSSPDEEQLSLRGQLSPSPHQFFSPRQFSSPSSSYQLHYQQQQQQRYSASSSPSQSQLTLLQGGHVISSRENTLSWGDESGGSSPRRIYPLTGSFSDMDLGFMERHRSTSGYTYNPYPTPHANSPEESPSKERREGGGGGGVTAAGGGFGGGGGGGAMGGNLATSTSPAPGVSRPLSSTRRASEPEFKRAGMENLHRFPRQKSLTDSDKRHPRHQQFLSIPRPASPEVKETFVIDKSTDESGHKKINKYVVLKEIGRGVHGKVKLCVDSETNIRYAMKIVKKPLKKRFGMREANPMEKLRVEIAILKKCDHQNVVLLYEVLDNPESTKIYLILEYLEGGSIHYCDELSSGPFLSIDASRGYFRDVLLGLEYLHYQGIVHRDLKPQNLLLTADNRVKISDFGVSHQSSEEGDTDLALAKTAGTPAFFAPELCIGSSTSSQPTTKAIDIWALGVTLYCFIYGTIPFQAESHFELYQTILNDPVRFPDDDDVSDELKDILLKMLEKDPTKRITIPEIKVHPWVTEGIDNISEWLRLNDPASKESIHVTLDEVKQALTIFGKFKRGIRRLSISLGSKLKSPKAGGDLDSDSSSSASLNKGHSKRPSASSLEFRNSSTSDEMIITTPVGAHFRSSSMSSNGNFRPTIKSSISQELFTGSDTESIEEAPLGRKSPKSPSNAKSLTEIEEEEDHPSTNFLRPVSSKKKDKEAAKGKLASVALKA